MPSSPSSTTIRVAKTHFAYVDHSGERLTVSPKAPAKASPSQPNWKLSLPERPGFKNVDHVDTGGLVAYSQFTIKGPNYLGGPYYFVLARESGSTSLGPYKNMGAVESQGEGESAVFAFSATVEGQEGSYVVLAKADGSERRFGPYARLVERPALMPEGDAVFGPDGALYFAAQENGITRLFKDGEELLRCSKLVGIDFAEGYRFPDGDGSAVISYRPEGAKEYYVQCGDRGLGPFDSKPVHIMSAGGHWLVECESSAYYDDRKLVSGEKFEDLELSKDGTRYAIQFGRNNNGRPGSRYVYDCYLHFNGNEYGPFDMLSDTVFDPQLRSFVLRAADIDGKRVAVGPAGRSAPASSMSAIAISPDAAKAAWASIQEDEATKTRTVSILLDGVALHSWKGVNNGSANVFNLRFSSDGRVLAANTIVEGSVRDMLFIDGALRTGSLSLDGKSAYFVEGDAIVSIPCGE